MPDTNWIFVNVNSLLAYTTDDYTINDLIRIILSIKQYMGYLAIEENSKHGWPALLCWEDHQWWGDVWGTLFSTQGEGQRLAQPLERSSHSENESSSYFHSLKDKNVSNTKRSIQIKIYFHGKFLFKKINMTKPNLS